MISHAIAPVVRETKTLEFVINTLVQWADSPGITPIAKSRRGLKITSLLREKFDEHNFTRAGRPRRHVLRMFISDCKLTKMPLSNELKLCRKYSTTGRRC